MKSLRTLDWKWDSENSFSGIDMACFLDWLALVVIALVPFTPTVNVTKLTRILVRRINDWQQAYGFGRIRLAVENVFAFAM